MNEKNFVTRYTNFVQLAVKLAEKAMRDGIGSLEEEVEDIDETEHIFKKGLYLIVDGTNPATVDEILTSMAEPEKDKTMRLYKTIQKRAILGIQAGESVMVLYKALSSLAGLPLKEEHKIELMLLSADTGPLVESIPPNFTGKGKYFYNDDSNVKIICEGDFVGGKLHGKGKKTWTDNGDTYEGDFVDGKANGKGKTSFADGTSYEGDFANDIYHGKGKYTFANGEAYEGDWADGNYNGKGKRTYADGRIEEGDWKDGELET